MSKASLGAACVLILAEAMASAQETREKVPAGTAKKGPERPAVVQSSPAKSPVPSPAPAASPSSARGRSGTEGRLRQYSESLLKRYDRNKNGVLEKDEWSGMSFLGREADRNGDGAITLDELTAWYSQMRSSVPARRPPSVSVQIPSAGTSSFSGRSAAETLGLSPDPPDALAPLVGLRVLVAELAVEPAGAKPTAPGREPASPLPEVTPEGTANLDLSAPAERLKEDLGKMGLRGRWVVFRNAQLAVAAGQVACLKVERREPEITGVHAGQLRQGHSIQYKNTGFILGVKPRGTPGGILTVDVSLEAGRIGSDAEGVPIWTPEKGDAVSARPLHTVSSRSVLRVQEGKTVAVAWADRNLCGQRRVLVVFLSAHIVKSETD